MNSQDYYYSVEPITKEVSKQEFIDFLNNYPRPLARDCCGISEPPAISYNDFELADRWPYSVVANTWLYDDNPDEYYYTPEEDRSYYIMTNYEEVFNSRTGNKTVTGKEHEAAEVSFRVDPVKDMNVFEKEEFIKEMNKGLGLDWSQESEEVWTKYILKL